jgi:hypothetical protein
MPFPIGTLVDLYDPGFQQWRGEYTVVKITDTGLPKIKNTKTNGQPFVKETVLRIGRLGPFSIKSLY